MSDLSDKERIDFIERIVIEGDNISMKSNTLIGSQPDMKEFPVQIFTTLSQHQYGKTVREVIDIAIKMERDKAYNPSKFGETGYESNIDIIKQIT